MTEQDKNRLFNLLIEKKITDKDYRRLELEALDDPFLFDAMEGIALNKIDHSQNIAAILGKINQSLTNKRKSRLPYFVTAAGLFGVLFAAYFIFFNEIKTVTISKSGDNVGLPFEEKYSINAPQIVTGEQSVEVVQVIPKQTQKATPSKAQVLNETLKSIEDATKTSSLEDAGSSETRIEIAAEVPKSSAPRNEVTPIADRVEDAENSIVLDEIKMDNIHEKVINAEDRKASGALPVMVNKAKRLEIPSKERAINKSEIFLSGISLSGVVKNANGEPMKDAKIISQQSSFTTAEDGSFSIFLPQGRNFIIVTSPDHETEGFYINENQKLNLTLKPIPSLNQKRVNEDFTRFNNEVQSNINAYIRQNKIDFNSKLTCYIKVETDGMVQDLLVISDYSYDFNQKVTTWIRQSKSFLPPSVRGDILTLEFLPN